MVLIPTLSTKETPLAQPYPCFIVRKIGKSRAYVYVAGAGEAPIAQSISTGLSCHGSYAEAIKNAICEVIERDAFTITWQAKVAPPQIPLESLDAGNRDLVARFERAGNRITLLNLTFDSGVPTVLAIARHNSREAPPFVVAAATSLDPRIAVQKSLEELALTRGYVQRIMRSLSPFVGEKNDVNTQQAHLHFWCDRENLTHAEFLFASRVQVPLASLPSLATNRPEQDLAALTERIQSLGHRVLVCDLTTPDVEALGLTVVRAVIPGFHPLAHGHRLRSLGGARIQEVPVRFGAQSGPKFSDNPFPHPYP